MAFAQTAAPSSRNWRQVTGLSRSLPWPAGSAPGSGGIWAMVAGIVGLLCCAISSVLVLIPYGTVPLATVVGMAAMVVAGLGLILLLARMSMHYHAQWQDARQACDMLRETIEALPAGVVVYDTDERLMAFNSVAAALTPSLQQPGAIGRTYEELVRDTALRLEAAGKGQQPVEEWIAQFRSKQARRTRQALDGRWFDWSERLTPGGRTVGLRVDITEVRNHEQALERASSDRVELMKRLEEETARLRSIVESSGALMVLVDRELKVVMVNSGFCSMTGIASSDAVGRPLHEILDCPLDCQLGETVRFAVNLRDPSGGKRLIAVTATPVGDADGRMSNIVLLGVDDTGRREAEQALHDAERFATVGEMAGTMAHEISQPLQVINIACVAAREELADAAEQGGTPDGQYVQSKLDRIAQQVERASRIIGDLRAFVRGTTADRSKPFDSGTAVQSAVKLTAYGVRQAGMALQASLADGLPTVAGDVGRLEQVLVNLINNARDAGGRAIGIITDAIHQDGRPFVRIAVEDSGPGIAPSILPQLFVAFVTTKPRGKGTGLGLRICRRIVEEMGGSISAANRAEGGARFEILLPAVTAPLGGSLELAAD